MSRIPRRQVGGAAGAAVYTLAGLVQRGLPILLLPVYARVLSPAEYGQVAVLIAATTVLGSLISLGLETSVVREVVRLRDDPRGRSTYLNSIGWFTLVAPALIGTLAWTLAVVGGGFGFDAPTLLFATLAVACQTSITVFIGAALRAEERLRDYLIVTLVTAASTAALTLFLLFGMGAGPLGWFAGAFAGGLVGVAVGLPRLRHGWTRHVSWTTLRSALLFGLPLVPHTLAHWVLNLSDRVILGSLVGEAEVGVYNLAYQAAAPISLVMIAVHQGVMPLYPRAAAEGVIRARLGRIVTGHIHLGFWLGMAAALLGPAAIVALFPVEYAGAGAYIPWIAIGYVLFGLYLIPMDSMSLMLGRTRWLWVPTVIAALSNLVINLVFVPRYGAQTAAVATAVGYGVLLGGVVIARRRLVGPRVPYQSGAIMAGAAWVIAVAATAMALFPSVEEPGSLVGRAGAVALAGGVLFAARTRRGADGDPLRQPGDASLAQLGRPEDAVYLAAKRA